MKQIILLAFALFFSLSSAVLAHDDSHDKPAASFQNGYIGVGGGIDLTGSNWNSDSLTYGAGGIGDVFGGYRFDKNLALQGEVQNFIVEGTYTTEIISQYNLRGLIEVKYTFDSPVVQPYLLAGGGVVYSDLNLTKSYNVSVNADALGALGVEFPVNPGTYLFVEGKYNFILSSASSLQDIPLTAGLWTAF